MTKALQINRLVIIGTGLIGGSLARALKAQNAVQEVIGVGRNIKNLQEAVNLDVIDRFALQPGEAVAGADVVVVATPVGAMEIVFEAIAHAVESTAVITDVGSVKAVVVAAARRHLGAHFSSFVPGHPIAGTEQSGVAASQVDLFEDRHVVLTPLTETNTDATTRVRRMWEVAGSKVIEMPTGQHDQVLGATSHLPHVLAYTLVDFLAGREDSELLFKLAAGGFYDFTRIASSDPVMWRDICVANREIIASTVRAYGDALEAVCKNLEQGDGQGLMDMFKKAKHARDLHLKTSLR